MKQTEIGLIPDDWEVKRLGDVAFLKSGKTIDFSATKEGIYPCYGGNGIRAYIPFYSHDGAFPIIGRQGELCGNVQYADGKFYATEHAVVCTPNNNVDSKWLYFQLIKADINKYKTGNAQPGISVDKINSEVFIPFPPIAEQQRIAKALSDADALISTTEKLIQKKKNIKQGTMQNLLTGKKRLPGFTKSSNYKQTEIGLIPEDWEMKNINKECTIKARIGWQGLKSTEYLDSGDYILITGTDFDSGFINWKSCSYVSKWRFDQDKNIQIKRGDVLITKDGTIGKVAFLNEIPMQGTLNSGVFVIRPKNHDKIDSVFLSLIFKSFWFDSFLEQITSGSTIVHLYQKDFVKFNFPLPSKEEQTAIANVLSSMDKEIETLNTKLEKYRNLKIAMMQQLLTGKIRLVK